MNSRDFCYWLQGYFEISNFTTWLDEQQTSCIKKHLAMVYEYELKKVPLNKMDKVQGFCFDLQQELSLLPIISKLTVKGIKLLLNEVFEHEIDNRYTEEENESLGEIHNPPFNYGPGMKC